MFISGTKLLLQKNFSADELHRFELFVCKLLNDKA